MNPKFVEREIIRQLRTRLREYFPSLQSFIDQKIITKYDWIFFGIVQLNLVKCFLVTPEKAIRKSKHQLSQILKFYQNEVRARKAVLKSKTFINENRLILEEIEKQLLFYEDHFLYWKNRKESSELYFHYEIFLFMYYKWMNSFEFEKENTIKLILDLMKFSNYYSYKYFSLERLDSDRNILLNDMKISGSLLFHTTNDKSIIDISSIKDQIDINKFKDEISAHL
mgnify:FL=1|tara:strand:- start:867 stop:1541 length:675 start_codon:yes stop_codon:yes gene_type:complete